MLQESICHLSVKIWAATHQLLGSTYMEAGAESVQPEGVALDLFGENGAFQTIANILLSLIGVVAVIMLIIGGFRYVVSGGDSSQVEGAKNTILYAIVGIVVAFLAYAAINFLTTQLQTGAQ